MRRSMQRTTDNAELLLMIIGIIFTLVSYSQVAVGVEEAELHPHDQMDQVMATDDVAGSDALAVVMSDSTGPHVLLLADVDNNGTTALMNALVGAGYSVTHRPAPEYTWDGTNPSLTGFDCVVHLNGRTYFQPLPVSGQTALVNFVSNGGGFIGSQWNGFERAVGQQTDMNDLVLQLWPQPDNCGGCNMTWTVVPGQEGHPVLVGVPSPFTFYADGHDAGPQVVFSVNPSTALMRSPGDGPAVLVREFGYGRVVNFSHAANYWDFGSGDQTLQDANIQQLYINAVAWASLLRVAIDIKPGSDPNSINLSSRGVIPVAILSTDGFDATQVDPGTVQLGGASVAARGKTGKLLAHEEDANADNLIDLIIQVETEELSFDDLEDGSLCLTGRTYQGRLIKGCDRVAIVPPKAAPSLGSIRRLTTTWADIKSKY